MKKLALLFAALAACSIRVYAANPIQIENAKPGSADWQLFREANGEIEGFASATSVNQGESISFYVNTSDANYTIDIYRMGWYGGLGARRVAPTVTRLGRRQPLPDPDPVTGLTECHWLDPYTITIPSDWISGIYLAKLSAVNLKVDRYIIFVVREDGRRSNHYFQSSVTTAQAYNGWGGLSLYSFTNPDGQKAHKVSFDRPYLDGSGTGTFLYRWEYNMVRFLEREGYDVTYCTDVDTHRRPDLMRSHSSFLSVGHDEYWSHEMRDHVEAALAAGVNLGFFSANTCYWQVRFEADSNGVPDRTVVGYKEEALTQDPYALDGNPANDGYVTTQFRLSPVNRPEASLLGVQYIYSPIDGDIVIDDVTSAPWVFEGTGLTKGSVITGLLGYEVDATDHAYTPAGTTRLAHSPFFDQKQSATSYSDMVVRTTANGATVFATGTIQWAWGLDSWKQGRPSDAARQITRNVLRRLAGTGAPNDCQFTISPAAADVTAAAGSGSVTLTTTSSCSWSASSSASWLTLSGTTSGSGNATISYSWTANDGAARTGTITIADKTFTVSQHACEYAVSPANPSIGAAGGMIAVSISSAGNCGWSATSNAPWITFSGPTSGSGNGLVTLSIAPTNGPARSGTATIVGTTVTVQQASGCTHVLDPPNASFPAAGGSGSINLTSSAGACGWTATSADAWITVTGGASGTGAGTITYTVAANQGSSRDGEILINGIAYNIHQSSGCTYTVSPASVAFTTEGGEGAIAIGASSGCFWKSTSNVPWIVITGGGEGNGNGTTAYSVQPNDTGATRTGTMTVAAQTVTITQTADSCTYDIAPAYAGYSAAAANGSIAVTPSGACSWLASVESGSSFLSITSGPSGTGPGTVTYSLKQNTSATARTGVIRIGSRTFNVTQNGAGAGAIALVATANGGSSVTLSWNAVDGATGYEILRSQGSSFFVVASVGGTSYADSGVRPIAGYLYRVRALSASGVISYSNVDVAVVVAFTDPTLIPRVTPVRAVHILELRQAVNAARAAAGLPPASWTDPSPAVIRAAHIVQLRSALDAARAALGLPPMSWSSFGPVIRAAEFQELRDAVR